MEVGGMGGEWRWEGRGGGAEGGEMEGGVKVRSMDKGGVKFPPLHCLIGRVSV